MGDLSLVHQPVQRLQARWIVDFVGQGSTRMHHHFVRQLHEPLGPPTVSQLCGPKMFLPKTCSQRQSVIHDPPPCLKPMTAILSAAYQYNKDVGKLKA